MLQYGRHRVQGIQDPLELDRAEHPPLGEGDQAELGRHGQAQSALRPHHDPGQVEGVGRGDEVVQVVAADPAQNLGIAPVDLLGMTAGQIADHPVAVTLQVPAPAAGVQIFLRHGSEMHQAPVRKHHVQLQNVVDGLAVDHGTGPRRVVGHGAAHRGPIRGGEIQRQDEAVGFEGEIQLVQDDPRLHHHGSALHVQVQDPVHVLGEVQLEAAADGLARLGGPPAPGGDGNTVAPAGADGPDHVLHAAGEHHPLGHDLVDAGVGGVDGPGDPVETDLPLERGAQGRFQGLAQGFGRHA